MLRDAREAPDPQADGAVIAVPEGGRPCSVAGCSGRYLARGFCIKHYYQVKRHGAVRTAFPGASRRDCKAEGCTGSRYALGYCTRHYRQNWRTTASGAPRSVSAFREEPRCREGACPEAPFSQGLCRLHYIMARYQDLVT